MANPVLLRSFTSMKRTVGTLAGVATIAVCALGAVAVTGAPAANADSKWVSIAYSEPDGISGAGEGMTGEEAEAAAIATCKNKGGKACEYEALDSHCLAFAVNSNSPQFGSRGFGMTLEEARNRALNPNDPNQRIVEALCTKPPAAEKQAPAPAEPVKSGTDTDGDGLSDRDEIGRFTNIFLPDTDLDGVSDGDEVKNGTNPLLLISN